MILYSLKTVGTYTRGELAQLARRRMVQKDHGDQKKYTRRQKHKKLDDI